MTGGTRTTNTVVFVPPKHYSTVILPTPEETLIEAAKNLGEALTHAACNNSVYPTLMAFSELQQLSDIINKANDTMDSPRVENPNTNEYTPLRVEEAPHDATPPRV